MNRIRFRRLAACVAAALPSLVGGPGLAQLPVAYDLRGVATAGGTVAWVSAVQNQGTAEDCWTFASATAMDSNLLMRGYLPTGSNAPQPEVSSWHLSTANGNPNQLDAALAFGNASNWGTSGEYPVLGYVTRGAGEWAIPSAPNPLTHVATFGGGPVSNNASVTPSNSFPASIADWDLNRPDSEFTPNPITSLLPPVNQPTAWRVTKMSILDQGFSNNVGLPAVSGTIAIGGTQYQTYSFTQGAADPQVQAVKQAILAGGAVTTFVNADYRAFSTLAPGASNSPTVNVQYVNPQIATGYSDHSVTIIGWDDTQPIASASGSTTGGWIVQNSWGTDGMGDAAGTTFGTFWASYDDAVIGRSGVASFELTPMSGWSQTVLQNELGPMESSSDFDVIGGAAYDQTGWIGSATGMAPIDASSVMSILTPAGDGWLGGLGLATQIGGVSVDVSIYEWDAALQSFGTLLATSTFANDSIGFFLGTLPAALFLEGGQSYAVQLDYEQGGAPVTGAAPVTIGGSGINGWLDGVTAGLSYYLDGGSWIDLNTLDFTSSSGPDAHGGILFLKGYLSTVPEIDPAGMASAMALAAGALSLLERRRGRQRVAASLPGSRPLATSATLSSSSSARSRRAFVASGVPRAARSGAISIRTRTSSSSAAAMISLASPGTASGRSAMA